MEDSPRVTHTSRTLVPGHTAHGSLSSRELAQGPQEGTLVKQRQLGEAQARKAASCHLETAQCTHGASRLTSHTRPQDCPPSTEHSCGVCPLQEGSAPRNPTSVQRAPSRADALSPSPHRPCQRQKTSKGHQGSRHARMFSIPGHRQTEHRVPGQKYGKDANMKQKWEKKKKILPV